MPKNLKLQHIWGKLFTSLKIFKTKPSQHCEPRRRPLLLLLPPSGIYGALTMCQAQDYPYRCINSFILQLTVGGLNCYYLQLANGETGFLRTDEVRHVRQSVPKRSFKSQRITSTQGLSTLEQLAKGLQSSRGYGLGVFYLDTP